MTMTNTNSNVLDPATHFAAIERSIGAGLTRTENGVARAMVPVPCAGIHVEVAISSAGNIATREVPSSCVNDDGSIDEAKWDRIAGITVLTAKA